MTAPAPNENELSRLAFKYEQLADLRRARAAGEPVPERGVFKALAREFPGALRELDMLPLDVIDARIEKLASAASGGGPIEPWMTFAIRYHALMRATLEIKAAVAANRAALDEPDRLAERASTRSGLAIDAAFVRAVGDPPCGRLNVLVFARIAAEHGVSPREVQQAVFGVASSS